jgi:hypothetical protein
MWMRGSKTRNAILCEKGGKKCVGQQGCAGMFVDVSGESAIGQFI